MKIHRNVQSEGSYVVTLFSKSSASDIRAVAEILERMSVSGCM